MRNPLFRLVTPDNVKQTVTPRRRPSAAYRTREHLTEAEVERLIDATKGNRHAHGLAHHPLHVPEQMVVLVARFSPA
jgi:hypothetical protein